MKRWTAWVAVLLVAALLSGCADAGSYVKDHYPLVSAQGSGSNIAKVYSAEGKSVPTVAHELASEEKPREMSKESPDQMFLVYDNKIVNIQKDPKDEKNSLVEIDSVQYAKEHYDSSFLQGYLTATVLQSLFGGGWFNRQPSYPGYRGYSTAPAYGGGTTGTVPPSSYGSSGSSGTTTKPSTSQGSGSFSTGKTGSGSVRKNDGSVPKVSNGAGSSSSFGSKSAPRTSTRSGSFKRK
jgi:hypothetical protein